MPDNEIIDDTAEATRDKEASWTHGNFGRSVQTDGDGSSSKDDPQRDAKLKAFADLLVLRFFSAAPGLVSFMIDSGVVGDAIEFSFWRLPRELVMGVKKLSGCDKVEVFKFYTKKAPCTGFRFHPSTKDLSEFEVGPSNDKEKGHAAEGHEDHPEAHRPAPDAAAGAA